jgi:hypothetical protein
VPGLRQEEVPQPQRAGFRLEFLDHRIDRPGTEPLGFFIEAPLVRIDVLIHEVAHALPQRLDAGGWF